jgi:hypothetical protein
MRLHFDVTYEKVELSARKWFIHYLFITLNGDIKKKRNRWSESVSELYRPSDHRLSIKLVPNFAYRGCQVSVADTYGRILGFLHRNRYCFFQVALQLYSGGWVDPIPDPLLLKKCSSAGNRTLISGSVARNSDHWTTQVVSDDLAKLIT